MIIKLKQRKRKNIYTSVVDATRTQMTHSRRLAQRYVLTLGFAAVALDTLRHRRRFRVTTLVVVTAWTETSLDFAAGLLARGRVATRGRCAKRLFATIDGGWRRWKRTVHFHLCITQTQHTFINDFVCIANKNKHTYLCSNIYRPYDEKFPNDD